MKKLVLALVALAVFAPAALAATSSLKVSPSKVQQGSTVTISGTASGHGCKVDRKGDSATIYSGAFNGATTHKFAGKPSITVSLAKSKHGAFSTKLTLWSSVKTGKYTVYGHCGSGNFGSTSLKVTQSSGQFY